MFSVSSMKGILNAQPIVQHWVAQGQVNYLDLKT